MRERRQDGLGVVKNGCCGIEGISDVSGRAGDRLNNKHTIQTQQCSIDNKTKALTSAAAAAAAAEAAAEAALAAACSAAVKSLQAARAVTSLAFEVQKAWRRYLPAAAAAAAVAAILAWLLESD